MTLGFKYGLVSHAKDWDDVPHVLARYAGLRVFERATVIQHGPGWARVCFGTEACVYSALADLQEHFPSASVYEFKGTSTPPPMPQ